MAYQSPNFSIPNFLGGINEAVDETLIKTNECKSMQNFDIERGVLSTSPGVQLYTTASLPYQIETLMTYYGLNTSELLAVSNGKIYKLNGSSFTELSSDGYTSNNFDYVNFDGWEGNVLIFGNGKQNTKVYTGSSVREMKHEGKNSDINSLIPGTSLPNRAPKMKFIELHYERIWGAGDEANPDTVYFSTAKKDGFDYDDWTYPTAEGEANQHGGSIDIPTHDGGHIVGLKVIFDDVIIFKRNNIFKIFGSYPGNYTKIQIFSANGGIADKTIQAGNNRAYFVAKDGIYVYDGTNVAPIHEKIKDTFSNINQNCIDSSVSVFHKNHYILAVPEGTSTYNNLIIDFNTNNNSYKITRGVTVNSFVKYNDTLLFSDTSGKIFIYGIGNTFNGSIINSRYETGFKDMGAQNAIKTSQYIYFMGSGNGSVRFTLSTEADSKSIEVPLTSTSTPYRKQLKNKGRLLNLTIENVNGSSITVKSPTVVCDVDYD